MKKIILSIIFLSIFKLNIAQVILSIPTVTQQQTEWCWAGCTNSILSYYGFNVPQCQIADYARTVISWHNFGTVNCCTSATAGCNYWNYNWGTAGSMEDILQNFGSITDLPVQDSLTFSTIVSEIDGLRPFIIRWGWVSGGGHFIVGKGYNLSSQSIYYMNPWPGEGAKIATYEWMQSDGSHDWTHTNMLLTSPTTTGLSEQYSINEISIFPNPTSNSFSINSPFIKLTSVELVDITGKIVYASKNTSFIDISAVGISNGIYILKLNSENKNFFKKIIIE